jgi:hypothetical protein
MRTLLATLAAVALVGVAVTAATAAPARTAKLTPAEAKWAAPVVTLWNTMNAGLQNVTRAASAKDALIVGTKNNLALTVLLSKFITCGKSLGKAGTAPTRLATFAGVMKAACTRVAAGGHDFAKAVGAVHKGNNTLASKLVIGGVGQFKQGTSKLALARRQLLALGGKNVFAA